MTPASKSKGYTRHVKSQDTPLPVCTGSMLSANILNKEIFDRLYALGMLVKKKKKCWARHIRDLTEQKQKTMAKKGVFTTEAVDKVDHNASRTTIKGSHGARGIALSRHPTEARHISRISVGTSNRSGHSNPCTLRLTTHLDGDGYMQPR